MTAPHQFPPGPDQGPHQGSDQSSRTSLAEALRATANMLAAAGVETPRLDARLLVQAVTGSTQESMALHPERPLSAAEHAKLAELAARRVAREPVSRILGQRAFWGRDFMVTPETLDPRPDTETLIELALDIVRHEQWRGRPLRILDIGTGTGAILLTLLAELEGATGHGTDISAGALEVAACNAQALGLSHRVTWQQTRSLTGIAGPFDLLVSNPPYIASVEIAALDPEVREFDPREALDGGQDGLDIVREIAMGAADCTSKEAWCLLEIGAKQAEATREIAEKTFNNSMKGQFKVGVDLGGHTRCVAWQPHT